ncbi:MAG: hypothetical protein FWF27_00940 [Candidatus Bathyarchaeota archaeon]|nr:hypothetical protein [Candidatus Termiticorpusculum sp.]
MPITSLKVVSFFDTCLQVEGLPLYPDYRQFGVKARTTNLPIGTNGFGFFVCLKTAVGMKLHLKLNIYDGFEDPINPGTPLSSQVIADVSTEQVENGWNYVIIPDPSQLTYLRSARLAGSLSIVGGVGAGQLIINQIAFVNISDDLLNDPEEGEYGVYQPTPNDPPKPPPTEVNLQPPEDDYTTIIILVAVILVISIILAIAYYYTSSRKNVSNGEKI